MPSHPQRSTCRSCNPPDWVRGPQRIDRLHKAVRFGGDFWRWRAILDDQDVSKGCIEAMESTATEAGLVVLYIRTIDGQFAICECGGGVQLKIVTGNVHLI